MKKSYIIIAIVAALIVGCKPALYTGPLDSPLGNWRSSESRYFFAGEEVFQDDSCMFSAISFYKDSLCCMEGMKGTFRWEHSGDSLVVDSTIWRVTALTGQRMALDYLGRIEQTTEGIEIEAEGVSIEYKGKTIESDGYDCWYLNNDGIKVMCWKKVYTKKGDDTPYTCWWDKRHDTYISF